MRFDESRCPQCGGPAHRFEKGHKVNFLIQQFWDEKAQKVFRKWKKVEHAFVRHCPSCNTFFVDFIGKEGKIFEVGYTPSMDLLRSIQAGPTDCPTCLKPALKLPPDDPRQALVMTHRNEDLVPFERDALTGEALYWCEPCNLFIVWFQFSNGESKTSVVQPGYDLRNAARYDPARCQLCGQPALPVPEGHPLFPLLESAWMQHHALEPREGILSSQLRQCTACSAVFADFVMRSGTTYSHVARP